MCVASLFQVLLAMVMEMWYQECGALRPIFAFFATLCHAGNTIPPRRKGSSQEEWAIPVAYDQRSVALCPPICSCGMVGHIQYTAIAMSCNFSYFGVLSPVASPFPWGIATCQRDGKPKPIAQGQRESGSPCIEVLLAYIAPRAYPACQPDTAYLANFSVLSPLGDPVAPGRHGV